MPALTRAEAAAPGMGDVLSPPKRAQTTRQGRGKSHSQWQRPCDGDPFSLSKCKRNSSRSACPKQAGERVQQASSTQDERDTDAYIKRAPTRGRQVGSVEIQGAKRNEGCCESPLRQNRSPEKTLENIQTQAKFHSTMCALRLTLRL